MAVDQRTSDRPSDHGAEPTTETMIRLDGLGKRYADGTVAVDDVSLDVRRGELVMLVGPSGGGKSTTLRLINRLIEPTSGSIWLDGARRHPQRPRAAAPRHRLRHPADRALPAPHGRAERRDRAGAARVGPRAHPQPGRRSCSTWSVSSRRRTPQRYPERALRRPAAARGRRPGARGRPARAAHGRAVRGGRPAGAGPPAGAVRRIQTELHKTVVFVTHDIDEAVRLGDRIAVLGRPESCSSMPTRAPCWPRPPTTASPRSWAPTGASAG